MKSQEFFRDETSAENTYFDPPSRLAEKKIQQKGFGFRKVANVGNETAEDG